MIISRSSFVFRNVFIIRYIIRHNGGRNRPFSRNHALYSVMSALTLYIKMLHEELVHVVSFCCCSSFTLFQYDKRSRWVIIVCLQGALNTLGMETGLVFDHMLSSLSVQCTKIHGQHYLHNIIHYWNHSMTNNRQRTLPLPKNDSHEPVLLSESKQTARPLLQDS